MGSVMSLSCSKKKETSEKERFSSQSHKRQKTCSSNDEDFCRLITNLPDELSLQILARLPRICYSSVQLVSWKWKSTLSNSELYSLRKELRSTEEWLYVLTKTQEDQLSWHALDPVSTKWQRLPPMPLTSYQEESTESSSGLWESFRVSEIVKSFLGRKETTSKPMPIRGCGIGSLDGCLYVLGGLSSTKTLSSVWRFDPVFNSWNEVTPMSTTRAYPKTVALNKKLYVVGGLDWRWGHLSPLKSAEVYDPSTDTWSEVPNMPFTKAQVLPDAFLADLLKPIATGVTCYKGKLCVPQSLYSWPFFVDAGGEVYDPETNQWTDMPSGMGEGWPARQASTKQSVVVDGELYSFDPSSSKIKVYDPKEDTWKVVIDEVPSYDLTDSESPYLLAVFHGKLHFITRDPDHKVTILQADVHNILGSSSSSSNTVSGSSSLSEKTNAPNKSESVIWNFIASKDFCGDEIVSCQVIDI